MSLDNEIRRWHAAEAIAFYRRVRSQNHDRGYKNEPDESVVGDLLTDLRHFCARDGVDFEAKLIGSQINYEAER
jgi:hypothetical protein